MEGEQEVAMIPNIISIFQGDLAVSSPKIESIIKSMLLGEC